MISRMNIKMVYEDMKNFYKTKGGDAFLRYFQNMFPKFNLYNFSLGWLESKNFILKFRGVDGDLIVGWL